MFSRLRRFVRRLRAGRDWIVYADAYDHTLPGVPLDAARADRILAFLTDERIVAPRAIARPRTATLEAILRIHTRAYVESLDRPETMTEIFGVPVNDAERQGALDYQRLATGGTVLAARLAWRTGRFAANLGGGYHHAGRERGMGFCLINDVAIAIAHLRHYGFTKPVLVVDLDLHDGNGTREIFRDDPTVHTFSIHNTAWGPEDGVATTSIALGDDVDDRTYLDALRAALPPVLEEHRPGFVFYNAGADVAADDRIGNWRISDAAIRERDRFVVEATRRAVGDVPCVMVLGGGYGGHAWRYPARFLAWHMTGTAVEPPDELAMILRRFRRLKTTLAATGQPRPDNWGLTAEDLVGVAPGVVRAPRLLDAFSSFAIELSLERAGILGALRARGFAEPAVVIDRNSPLGETIRVFGDSAHTALLIELRVTRSRRAVPGMEVLYVEWLLLQNPREAFSEHNPQLPGQTHPGLGLLKEVVGWLVILCEMLGLDGLAFTPAEYYMAVLGRHHMRFLDPAAQGRFIALRRALASLSLAEASDALATGRVVDDGGNAVRWTPAVQVYPVSTRLHAAVEGDVYDAKVREACDAAAFELVSS